MQREFEVKWSSHGTTSVVAGSQEEAEDMFNDAPLDWVDMNDLCDNCYAVKED